MSSCVRHPMAVSEHVCGRCGHEFCPECVVFPFGVAKPPMCVSCALEAGGVRHQHTGRPRLGSKMVKRRLKDQGNRPGPALPPEPEPEVSEWDDEWMRGELDPEKAGGWSKKF